MRQPIFELSQRQCHPWHPQGPPNRPGPTQHSCWSLWLPMYVSEFIRFVEKGCAIYIPWVIFCFGGCLLLAKHFLCLPGEPTKIKPTDVSMEQAGQFDFDALAFSELEEAFFFCGKLLACWLLVQQPGCSGKKTHFWPEITIYGCISNSSWLGLRPKK